MALVHTSRFSSLPVRERQWKHVYESAVDAGKSHKVAERIASAVVNKTRARFAKSGRGPKLVGKGGSRRQWYPGKAKALGSRETFACLKHRKKFKSKAGMLSHFRGKVHGKRR